MTSSIVVVHQRPLVESYDSAVEFSLTHWSEVWKLVDEADLADGEEGLPSPSKLEKALDEALSEVEPTTTYEYFAGNIV